MTQPQVPETTEPTQEQDWDALLDSGGEDGEPGEDAGAEAEAPAGPGEGEAEGGTEPAPEEPAAPAEPDPEVVRLREEIARRDQEQAQREQEQAREKKSQQIEQGLDNYYNQRGNAWLQHYTQQGYTQQEAASFAKERAELETDKMRSDIAKIQAVQEKVALQEEVPLSVVENLADEQAMRQEATRYKARGVTPQDRASLKAELKAEIRAEMEAEAKKNSVPPQNYNQNTNNGSTRSPQQIYEAHGRGEVSEAEFLRAAKALGYPPYD